MSTVDCLGVVENGAIANDNLSDRVAFQASIDLCSNVYVPEGVWDFDRAGPGGYNAYTALTIHRPGVTVTCAPGATLRVAGDQGGQPTILIAIEPGAENISVTGCTLELTATNTAEQTHAIATTGVCNGAGCLPIRNIAIEGNTCRWPRLSAGRIGDCVRLLGNTPETEVWRVRIANNDFNPCGRSCVTLQRGLHDTVIANNTMLCGGDQCIDGEATGGAYDYGTVITGNTMTSAPEAQGDYAVTLTSQVGATISGNTMDRGIAPYRTKDVVISGNVISGVARGTEAWIYVRNQCDGVVITGNTIRRTGVAGPIIQGEARSGVACEGLTVTGNNITQGTAHVAVMGVTTPGLRVTGNNITHTVVGPSYASIYVLSSILAIPVHTVQIADNTIRGALTYAVTLEGYPGQYGAGLSVTGNIATQTTFGLRTKNPTYFLAPLTVAGNAMGPSSSSVPSNTGS